MFIDIKPTTLGGFTHWWRLEVETLGPHHRRYITNLLNQSQVNSLPAELLADLRADTDEPCYLLYIEGDGGSQTTKIRQRTVTEPLKQLVEFVMQNSTNRGNGTWEEFDRQQRINRELRPILSRLIQQLPPGFNQSSQLTQYLAGELLDLVADWGRLQRQSDQSPEELVSSLEKRLTQKTERVIRTSGPLRIIR